MINLGSEHVEPLKEYMYNFTELLANGFMGIKSKVTLRRLCEAGDIEWYDVSYSGERRQIRIKGKDVIKYVKNKKG